MYKSIKRYFLPAFAGFALAGNVMAAEVEIPAVELPLGKTKQIQHHDNSFQKVVNDYADKVKVSFKDKIKDGVLTHKEQDELLGMYNVPIEKKDEWGFARTFSHGLTWFDEGSKPYSNLKALLEESKTLESAEKSAMLEEALELNGYRVKVPRFKVYTPKKMKVSGERENYFTSNKVPVKLLAKYIDDGLFFRREQRELDDILDKLEGLNAPGVNALRTNIFNNITRKGGDGLVNSLKPYNVSVDTLWSGETGWGIMMLFGFIAFGIMPAVAFSSYQDAKEAQINAMARRR
ncbi:hypothetical protein KY337_03120 [Candidatus Woesearchaeota archaeon]|nr:hypothetical protein [Candidatus Woesearchaeota archaeon]